MTKIVYLFAVVALVQVASGLECYTCGQNCEGEKSQWAKTACGKVVGSDVACLKQVYTDAASKKEVSVRKCIIQSKQPNGAITPYKCNEAGTSMCEVCTTDLCNSAPSVNISFVTLLGIVAAYLVPKFL